MRWDDVVELAPAFAGALEIELIEDEQSVVKNSRSRDSSSSGIASPLTSRAKCSDAMWASKAASSAYCS